MYLLFPPQSFLPIQPWLVNSRQLATFDRHSYFWQRIRYSAAVRSIVICVREVIEKQRCESSQEPHRLPCTEKGGECGVAKEGIEEELKRKDEASWLYCQHITGRATASSFVSCKNLMWKWCGEVYQQQYMEIFMFLIIFQCIYLARCAYLIFC